uniref:ANK_REP_REGION domain-containing protein n=1 Tax=Anopheles christyi TaxID=43041 RepID=A0A182KDM6_9DIPT
MAKLGKVLWAGQGMRLRTETSHHPRMKRFLECVPHVMGVIKDIHQAVIDNDLDVLKEKTAPPAPRVILTSKDANGLTPLHKAAGLAHTQIVEYILSVWPSLSSDEDHTGKTPLHWAASAKNNARSFNLLVQAGADETALDDRNKAAEHYKNKPGDIDRSLLAVIPEAPRISQQGFPAYFDWAMFTLPDDSDEGPQPTRMKPFLSQNNLLDVDGGQESGASSGVADTVSKSKSVHSLTNGDGTLVEHEEQISTPPAGTDDTNAPLDVLNEKIGDVGDSDDHTQVMQNTEPEVGEVESLSEAYNEEGLQESDAPNTAAEESMENGHINTPAIDEDETNGNDAAASRNTSANEATRDNFDKAAELEPEKETNSSPAALEEAEVSRDSLEQVASKDDEIEQDSLGKDLEPEEPLPEEGRVTSAQSEKDSIQLNSQTNSRATTGKSIKSTITMPEQEDAKLPVSRNSSATVLANGRPDTASKEVNGNDESNDAPDMLSDRDEVTSAKSEQHASSAHRTYPNSAKEPTSPASRPISRTEMENISRAASSTLTPGRTPGKSSNSSTPNRKGSIVSRKSVNSTLDSAAHTQHDSHGDGEEDDDSEANDDSNNADVQIASYRTPDELAKTPESSPNRPEIEDQQQNVDETSSTKEEPLRRAEVETATQSASAAQSATATTEPSSQVLEIEGTVQGEPDQGQLESQNEQPVELEEQPNVIPYFFMFGIS